MRDIRITGIKIQFSIEEDFTTSETGIGKGSSITLEDDTTGDMKAIEIQRHTAKAVDDVLKELGMIEVSRAEVKASIKRKPRKKTK